MFTLSYQTLQNQAFVDAMGKIETCDKFPSAKISYDMGKMVKEIFDALLNCQREFIPLLKEYAIVDDKGNIIPTENEEGKKIPNSYKIRKEKLEEWAKTLPAFLERTVSIHRHKLDMDNLSCVGLTPTDMLALEPILLT